MRTIYFSPHLDDAILSAGGLIYDQAAAGTLVEIWSFMAGAPENQELTDFARALHEKWGLGSPAEAVALRREEDRQAAARVGAKAVHFDFPDCIYRRSRKGPGLYEDVFVPIHPEDADLPAQIAQAMIAWLHPDDRIVCQLGFGGHVDHILVRRAAEMLHRSLLYDADIPYWLDHPEEPPYTTAGMTISIQPVSESGLKAWIEAIACYASQVESVFGGQSAMPERINDYWGRHHGIPFWHVDNL